VGREILRPDRHLFGIQDDAPRQRRSGRRKIPNQGNGLSRINRGHPLRTLTAPASHAANWWQSRLREFSLRQSRDGDVAGLGSVKNATAKHFPQICHAAERFGGGGWGASGKPACQKYPIWVQISPEWVQIQFR
jgi:hypothetical protein